MTTTTYINNLFKKFCKQRRFHCIGDSHVDVFRYIYENYIWIKTNFNFCVVHGATAMGLANPRSKTNALHVFSNYIEGVQKDESVLFCLGEVDCGFVIWYRALKNNMSVEDQFELSIRNYQNLIMRAANRTSSILVLSTPLPTIFDGHEWGEVAHARSDVKASIRERTDLSLRYNRALQDFTLKHGFTYIDLQRHTLDLDSTLISRKFLNSNPLDHHLDPVKIAPVIRQELKSLNFY